MPEKIIKDEITDWKTYRNKEYGFEFRYPSTYEIDIDSVFVGERPVSPTHSFHLFKYFSASIKPFSNQDLDRSVAIAIKSVRREEWQNQAHHGFFLNELLDVYIARSTEGIFQDGWRNFGGVYGDQYFETSDGTKRGVSYFSQSVQSAATSISYIIDMVDKDGNLFSIKKDLNHTEKVIAIGKKWDPVLTSGDRVQINRFLEKEVSGFFGSSQARQDLKQEINVDELSKIINSAFFLPL